MSKIAIYQVLPRLFGNYKNVNIQNGTINENGCGKFNSFNTRALEEIKSLGITHIWYTGILEHATKTDYTDFGIKKDHAAIVKGNAGSAYAIKDYYDVDPDLAVNVHNRMNEFQNLVNRTHKAGLKVLIDFVPNHVARQYCSDAKPTGVIDLGETDCSDWAFSPLNNFYYLPNQAFKPNFDIADYTEFPAKATGNDQFTSCPNVTDWYETIKLNYGVNYTEGGQQQFNPIPDTWHKMLEILLYWAAKKIDGFRCDMAEMVPVAFWAWVIPQVKIQFPHVIFIAEVYDPEKYRTYIFEGKFDYLYDKVGMYDTLRNVTSKNHAVSTITSTWQAVSDIEDHMLKFLENHDEQRIASGFFSGDGKYAQPAMIVAATLTKAPVMIYCGQELGEQGMDAEGFSGLDGRTTIFDYWCVKSIYAWANKGKFDGLTLTDDQWALRSFYKQLLNIVQQEKAISDGLMYDLGYANTNNPFFNLHEEFAFFRKYDDDLLLIVLNFDDKQLETKINIPIHAFEYLGLDEHSQLSCENLLDENETLAPVYLSSQHPYYINMPAWTGKIIKMKKIIR